MDIRIWTVASLLLGAAPAMAAQAPAEQDYDLPRQPLERSVLEVSRRSGRSLVAPSALLEGRTAPELRGRYGPGAALDALLAGSGLRAEPVDGGYVIRRGEPGPGEEDAIVWGNEDGVRYALASIDGEPLPLTEWLSVDPPAPSPSPSSSI